VTSRKVFSVLWRANAVIIFIAGILGCVALAAFAFLLYSETTRHGRAQDVLTIAEDEVRDTRTTLGDFEEVSGSSVLRAELRVEQEYSAGSLSKESRSTQNYLFFDPAHDASYWLIPGFKGIIRSSHDLPDEDSCEKKTVTQVVVYELSETDSNHDGQLTSEDVKDVAIADPAGTQLTRVLKGVDGFNSARLLPDESQILLFYTQDGVARAARIEFPSGKILKDVPIKPLKNPAR
jgi:hypothetical protein